MKMHGISFGFAVAALIAMAGEPADAKKTGSSRTPFSTLPLCRLVEGRVEVRFGDGEWTDAVEGKFYPLGSAFRASRGARMVLAFGADSTATLFEDSEFVTRAQALGRNPRTIVLVRGVVELDLPKNLPEGAFFVTAPGFTVKNPAGESRFEYEDKGDGDRAVIRCKTGSVGIEGRHFDIPVMHSADEIVIRTSHDHLVTFLYGTSGDYAVRVDQGLRLRDEIGNDGQVSQVKEKGTLEWRLTPSTKVVINRSVPAIGERMSVHTMAFDASGERKSECYFCEGRTEVNSGELVQQEKVSGEELAKRAAEATETTAATDADDSSSEAAKGGASEASTGN